MEIKRKNAVLNKQVKEGLNELLRKYNSLVISYDKLKEDYQIVLDKNLTLSNKKEKVIKEYIYYWNPFYYIWKKIKGEK